MRYITDTTEFQVGEPTIMALGEFDGRHRGYQKLLRAIAELRVGTGYPTAIFTFSTAPGTVVTGQPQAVITTNLKRRTNMERMGVDYLVEYPSTDKTRHMGPEVLIRDILAGHMHAREIVVGPDCGFGYKEAGSAALPLTMVHDLGYHLRVIEKEKGHRRDISSTYIHEGLEKGSVEKVNQPLGQPYAIHGETVHGSHIGDSLLGFPIANILPPPIKRLPRYGVYISHVLVDDVYYKGATNIGKKPTVGGGYPAGVKTYIFDLEGDIYGKDIGIQILALDHLEQKFTSLEELKERVERNKEFADVYYEEHPGILVEK